MTTSRKWFLRLLAVATLAYAQAAHANGGSSLVIDLYENGPNVEALVQGSFDIASLVPQEIGNSNFTSYTNANAGLFGFSSPSPSGTTSWVKWRIDEAASYTAPFWGDGSLAGSIPFQATSSSGVGTLQLEGNPLASPETSEARIRLPSTYAGETINGSAVWANKTLADLGLQSSGTWNWTTANGGAVMLRINAVPEPSTVATLAIGVIGTLVTASRRLRRMNG